ncbi:hypothetical protein GYH30_040449 [Glycine max]|nr:hypothetical protein GYH30_040449 [Glycine max]
MHKTPPPPENHRLGKLTCKLHCDINLEAWQWRVVDLEHDLDDDDTGVNLDANVTSMLERHNTKRILVGDKGVVHHHQGLNGFHYVDEGNQSMDIGGEVAVKWFAVEKGSEEKV